MANPQKDFSRPEPRSQTGAGRRSADANPSLATDEDSSGAPTDHERMIASRNPEDFQVIDESIALNFEDDPDLEEDGLAPMEDTPTAERLNARDSVNLDELSEEIELSSEQMDAGEMNEKDARESGYINDDAELPRTPERSERTEYPTGGYTDIGAGRSSSVRKKK